MIRLIALAITLLATPALAAPARMGVNLSPTNYWTENGFIDILKTSGRWSTYPGTLPVDLDVNGLPRAMPAGATMLSRMIYLPPASPAAPVLYEMVTDGEVTAQIQFATVVSSKAGRTVFSYTGTSPNGVALVLRGIKKPPTFMRLSRADETALLDAGETWRPAFLAQLRGFSVLRFMDWMKTNHSPYVDSYPSNVAAIDYLDGVPIAVMNDLCAKVQARCWLNIPARASDALIATMIGAAPTAIWEPSNEVWNLSFQQGKDAAAAGSDGKGTGGGAAWYGRFATRVAAAARGTGAGVVLGWQTAVPSRAQPVWNAVAAAGGRDADFAGWIIASYINGSLTEPSGNAVALATANDIAGALENLRSGTGAGFSVEGAKALYTAHGAIAKAHGMPLLAYEGNFHLNSLPHLAKQQPLVVPFFERVQRAPGAQAVMAANLDAFEAAGGKLNVFFNLSSASTGNGFFGIAGTPTMDEARRRMASAATIVPEVAAPDVGVLMRDVRTAVDKLEAAIRAAVRD